MNIKDLMDKGLKIRTSITLDKSLLEDLEAYKKKHKIKSLSPMINVMLEEWLRQQEKAEDDKNDNN